MFNLYQMVSGAHGGQGLDSLARQFGLSRQQADSAVQALIPALSTAFMTKAAQPGGLGAIASAMTDDQHKQAYANPSAAQDSMTQQKGGGIVGDIFGNNAIVGEVTQQASRYTGIPEATLRQMLPVVASIIVGGAATAMHNQGMGGMLGQLANGGLGNILGQFGGMGATGGNSPVGAGLSQTGGFAGMLGNIFSSFMGGAQPATTPGAAPTTPADPAGGLPPVMQAGMDELFKMFQPGVSGQGGAPSNLGEMIAASLNPKK